MENFNSEKIGGSSKKLIFTVIVVVVLIVLAVGGYYLMKKPNVVVGDLLIMPTTIPPVSNSLDSDKDGLPDSIEKVLGTNINNSDTDGDTYDDLSEIKSGYSPLFAGSLKLMPEELQVLKDKIKAVDNIFYENNFGVEKELTLSPSINPNGNQTINANTNPTPTISTKKEKCNFVNKIGNYVLPNFSGGKSVRYEKNNIIATYFSLSEAGGVELNFYFPETNNTEEVLKEYEFSKYMYLKSGFKYCTIDNINVLCMYQVSDDLNKSEVDIKSTMNIILFDGFNQKLINYMSSAKKTEEVIKKDLLPFITQFKECTI